MNTLGGTGLWDEEDGFYYDQLHVDGEHIAAPDPLAGRAHPAVRGRGAGRGQVRAAGRLPAADALVPRAIGPTWRGTSPTCGRGTARGARAAAAGHSVARAAGAGAALPAGRDRVPLAPRHPLRVAGSTTTSPTCSTCMGEDPTGWTTSRRGQHRAVRRQLQLARAGLVPDQLPAGRGARALPPLLRRRAPGRVPGGLGPAADPGSRWRRSWRRGWPASFCPTRRGRRPCHGDDPRYADRSPLEGPRAVPRVLPRRHRPRRRRQPPDRLDRAGASAASKTSRAGASRRREAPQSAASRPLAGEPADDRAAPASTTPPSGSRPTASAASPPARRAASAPGATTPCCSRPPRRRPAAWCWSTGFDAWVEPAPEGSRAPEYLTRQRYAPDVVAPGRRRGARVLHARALADLDATGCRTAPGRARAVRALGASRSWPFAGESPAGRAPVQPRRAPASVRPRLPRAAPRERRPSASTPSSVAARRDAGGRTPGCPASSRSTNGTYRARPAVVSRLPLRRGACPRARLRSRTSPRPACSHWDLAEGDAVLLLASLRTSAARIASAAVTYRPSSVAPSTPAAPGFASPLRARRRRLSWCAAARARPSSPAIRGSPTGAATRSSPCAGSASPPAA